MLPLTGTASLCGVLASPPPTGRTGGDIRRPSQPLPAAVGLGLPGLCPREPANRWRCGHGGFLGMPRRLDWPARLLNRLDLGALQPPGSVEHRALLVPYLPTPQPRVGIRRRKHARPHAQSVICVEGPIEVSQLQVTQVQRRLQDLLVPFIDVTDLAKHSGEHLENAQLTRALSAFLIMKLTGLNAEKAAATVTDGSGDNGIDSIAVVPDEQRIVVVQSKWTSSGKGSAALDDMIKFKKGLDDLCQLKWKNFNEKLRARQDEIEAALLETSTKIDIVFAHMGTGTLAPDVRDHIEEFVSDTNNTDTDDARETARFNYYGQGAIFRLLVDETQSPKIDLSVTLAEWGQIEGPPKAIYGLVSGADVASWYEQHGSALLAKNVRVVLPDSEVNASIVDTLQNRPDAFWYYNNGVTVLCDRFQKAVAGGTNRAVGHYVMEGASVVNGAQTVGALSKAKPHSADRLAGVQVTVRFISLDKTSETFAAEVTRATNTQNRIGGRDFLSLDSEQVRLRDEFRVAELTYTFRSGEADPDPELGCSVTDATIALACSQPSSALAVLAKREVGRLWDDITKSPYRLLFNTTTNYLRVWRCVQVMRVVEHKLESYAKSAESQYKGIVIHGNRLILHLVFRQLDLAAVDQPQLDWEAVLATVHEVLLPTIATVITVKEADFNGYAAPLFKNATKAAALTAQVLDSLQEPGAMSRIPPDLQQQGSPKW